MKPIYQSWFCQIDITSKCFMACLYCSRYNRHLREDQKIHMPLEDIERALDSLKEWPSSIGIIGGEPLLHPQFKEICELIQTKFSRTKMGLWTSGGKNWTSLKPLADKTFGFIAYNEHNREQQEVCRHQRLTVAIKDVIKDETYMNELIDDCWVQRTWCPAINVKGAFFCEVAAAQDLLWDGPGGWLVDKNWWRKTQTQFKDQCDTYCMNCGMCIPMERDLIRCGVEKMSPTVYDLMKQHNNSRIEIGKNIELFTKQFSIEEIEDNKLKWYPGNYRGDKHEDHSSPEGRGSTIFRKRKPKIELMTLWYNEEFLAPYFLNHYKFIDTIHLFLDSDTNDTTKEIISQYNNVSLKQFTFPDRMDDEIKINLQKQFIILNYGMFIDILQIKISIHYCLLKINDNMV